MICFVQMKCCKYWPDESELYGDIKITLLKTETLAEYTVRTFAMERVRVLRYLSMVCYVFMSLNVNLLMELFPFWYSD